MTNLKVLSAADIARKKLFVLRQSLSSRAGVAPVVEGLLPALPGDDVAKLQLARQGTDCKVILTGIVPPPGARPGDTFIALRKDKVAVSGWIELPLPPPDPWEMTLPATETATPGPFRLSYLALYGSNQSESEESVFFIDTVAPNHGAPGEPAAPPAEIVNGLLTRDILDALGDITMTIPPPDDIKQGDVYIAYYGKSDPGIYVSRYIVDLDSTLPIEIKIPKTTIEATGEGKFIFYCKYEDRVGNVGPSSKPFELTVQLTPTPSGLQPPEVPENDDGVVDLKDAFPGVAVMIPTFDNGLPGDQVQVTFDGIVQPPKPTDGTIEVIVDVPFADVAQKGDGPRDVVVTYAIVRNGEVFPEPTGTTINVNLSIPGPDNPEPDPEVGNPNLTELVVKGSTDDDVLEEADVGTTVDIDLELYTGAILGDVVHLVWEGSRVPGADGLYTVTGTEPAGFKIPFKLPSAVFEATGNGIKVARYVITNVANGDNENPSKPTPVDVYILPVTLAPPVIQHLSTNPIGLIYLDCFSLRDIPVVGKAAIVRVAGGAPLVANMTLSFNWVGTPGAPGAPPVDDFPFEKTLQGNEHINGFDVYLPYTTALKPIRDGDGEIKYTTVLDGRTHTSPSHKVRVLAVDFDDNYCPGT